MSLKARTYQFRKYQNLSMFCIINIKSILIPILLIFYGCSPESSMEKQNKPDPTKEMKEELKTIASQTDNIQVWHLNKLRALAIDEKLKTIQDPGQRISLLFKSAIEWLNAGDYQVAISRLNQIFSFIKDNNLSLDPNALKSMTEMLGMVYLRKAEIENCIQNHNAHSCLIPIEPPGQHTNRAGSESALKIFKGILDENPDDIQVKWLYNITQMTLGGYPDQVESPYLIDPSVFESEVDFPRFTEKAMELGIGVNDISGSLVMDDFNNDHYLDLMVSSYGLDDQLHYFQNNKKGGFDDMTASAGLTGLWSGLNMIQADYNNDGWVDVLILRGAWLGKDGNHPNSLLRNNGNGTFSDVTKETGLYCHFPTQSASWADFNNDGWIDLFIANEHSNSVNAPCQLFENQKDGTFKEVAQEKGLAIKSFIKGCIWGDYDNDSYPDLYLSLIKGDNFLMKNGGANNDFKFTNVSVQAKTVEPQLSFPCWFFDYNQDGWEDIFVSGFDFKQFETAAGEVAKDYLNQPLSAELPRLYQNNKNGTFTEVSKDAQVDKVLFTMGCNFGDLNNDGYPDFYAATGTPDFRALIPNRMFLNEAGKQFSDVTKAGGFGHLQKGHGVAFGDIDMDGDQDIYHVLGGSYDGDNFMNAFFVNPGNENNWVKLKLNGTHSNKSAIGARVKIVASNSKGETHNFFSKVNSGGSFGANPLLIEQGLGDFDKIDQIEIIWPGQKSPQIIQNVKVGSYLLINEGESAATEIELTPFILQGEHHH